MFGRRKRRGLEQRFLASALQSSDTLKRRLKELRERQDAGDFTAFSELGLVLLTLALRDDRYQKDIEQWEKESFVLARILATVVEDAVAVADEQGADDELILRIMIETGAEGLVRLSPAWYVVKFEELRALATVGNPTGEGIGNPVIQSALVAEEAMVKDAGWFATQVRDFDLTGYLMWCEQARAHGISDDARSRAKDAREWGDAIHGATPQTMPTDEVVGQGAFLGEWADEASFERALENADGDEMHRIFEKHFAPMASAMSSEFVARSRLDSLSRTTDSQRDNIYTRMINDLGGEAAVLETIVDHAKVSGREVDHGEARYVLKAWHYLGIPKNLGLGEVLDAVWSGSDGTEIGRLQALVTVRSEEIRSMTGRQTRVGRVTLTEWQPGEPPLLNSVGSVTLGPMFKTPPTDPPAQPEVEPPSPPLD